MEKKIFLSFQAGAARRPVPAAPAVLRQGPQRVEQLAPPLLRQLPVEGQQLLLVLRQAAAPGPGIQAEQPVGGGMVEPEQGGQGLQIRLRDAGIT